jgi:hypothetical protein
VPTALQLELGWILVRQMRPSPHGPFSLEPRGMKDVWTACVAEDEGGGGVAEGARDAGTGGAVGY